MTTADVDAEVIEVGSELEPVNGEVKPAKPKRQSKYKWEDPGLDPKAKADDKWPHEHIDFLGDHLAVRKPQMQALGGYQLATSGFMSDEKKTKYTGLFIARHLSDETWARVMDRLMDPDDPDYDEDAIGALMGEVVELTTGKAAEPNRKARRHPR